MGEMEEMIMQIGAGDPGEGPFLGFKEPLQKINKYTKSFYDVISCMTSAICGLPC